MINLCTVIATPETNLRQYCGMNIELPMDLCIFFAQHFDSLKDEGRKHKTMLDMETRIPYDHRGIFSTKLNINFSTCFSDISLNFLKPFHS